MYLHIGDNEVLHKKNIVAIIDLKKIKINANQTYIKWRLSKEEQKKMRFYKSLILTEKGYLFSSLSSQILMRRSEKDI